MAYMWEDFETPEDKAARLAAADKELRKQGTYVNGVYQPLVMATGGHSASDTTAAILRGNYENWKKTYFPKIADLMDMTTYKNPGIVAEETNKAALQVDSSFANAREDNTNNLARYGLSVDPTSTRATDLAQTAATVGAKNNTRTYLADRDKIIASGGLPSAVAGGS